MLLLCADMFVWIVFSRFLLLYSCRATGFYMARCKYSVKQTIRLNIFSSLGKDSETKLQTVSLTYTVEIMTGNNMIADFLRT